MAYTKTVWVNDTSPAINETNLNKIEQGIYDNDTAIGDITDLDTTATNLVEAINEVNTNLSSDITNIGTELDNIATYSTTETRIGTYNGKPLYRKIFVNQAGPELTVKEISHGISNIDKITNLYGTMVNPQNKITINLGFHGITNYYGPDTVVLLRADAQKIYYIAENAAYPTNLCDFIIEYTKTTD